MTTSSSRFDPALVRGWRRALDEFDLHRALDQLAPMASRHGEGDRAAYLERAVALLQLPGHEAGPIAELAQAQIAAEFEGLARFDAVGSAAYEAWNSLGIIFSDRSFVLGWSYPHLIEGWKRFKAGDLCLRVAVPTLGYFGGVEWNDVAPFLASPNFADDEPQPAHDFRENPDTGVVEEYQAGWGTDTADWYEVELAIVAAIAVKGLFRGPCESCGFERWPVPWRPRSSAGRPRLSDRLCPACELARVRKTSSLGQQAYARRRSSGRPAGRPRKEK